MGTAWYCVVLRGGWPAWRVACVEGGHAAVSHSPCWPHYLLCTYSPARLLLAYCSLTARLLLAYCSLTARVLAQAAIFLHEELGGAQAMGGALIVAANLLA